MTWHPIPIINVKTPGETVESVGGRGPRIWLRVSSVSLCPPSGDVHCSPRFLQLSGLLHDPLNPLWSLIVHTTAANWFTKFLKNCPWKAGHVTEIAKYFFSVSNHGLVDTCHLGIPLLYS